MFTGLIQDVGTVEAVRPGPTTRLEVRSAFELADVVLGESIAVDGCCLTVVSKEGGRLAFDASAETLRRTTLGGYRPGSRINLERAMQLGDRLGGHLVLGHVDATSEVLRAWTEGGSLWLELALPKELAPFFIEKGSVTIDGISLTVNTLGEDRFGVTLIPETQVRTTLASKAAGAKVNLEADLIGKYVARMVAVRPGSKIDEDFLKRAGFGWPR